MTLAATFSRRHRAAVELGMLAGLYGVYEIVRGAGDASLAIVRDHTSDIVSLERTLHVFGERTVQAWSHGVPYLPMLLGIAYMSLHFGATTFALRWVYRERREAYPLVRTTLVASTALALVGYVLYPAAPPRLAWLGFSDTVTARTRLNLRSNMLGSLYNPFAAGRFTSAIALIVGAALVALARRRWVRVLGAAYPAFMLFVIVATGNHFFFDAAAGGVVVVAGWWIARALVREPRPAARTAALARRPLLVA